MTLPPVYNPNIPENQSASIGKDQMNFLDNFAALYNAFSVNHVPLDATSGAGNHTIVQLIEQTAAFPANTGEISAYARAATGQSDQVFLRYQGDQNEFQYTAYQLYSLPTTTSQTSFFTVLPGRIMIYFGQVTPGPSVASFPIKLFPEVAINIITVNLCPLAVPGSAQWQPNVTLQAPGSNGIYNQINLLTSNRGILTLPTSMYYVVLANI
jgi:hypothetical protein